MSAPTSLAGAEHCVGTVEVDFGDGGSARWADLSDADIDPICAFIETIKRADTIT